MYYADARVRQALLPQAGAPRDGFHAVMQVVHLPAARQLTPNGVEQHTVVLLEHEGLHRMAVERRFLDRGHIPDAGQRHVERARDGGCGQRQHVNRLGKLFERFLVGHAEALFLVHNQQTKVFEFDFLVKQLVRADHDIDRPGFQFFEQQALLRAGFVAREQLDRHRMALEPLQSGQVVLAREHGRRHKDGGLLARKHALHHGAQRNLGFAETHIAAEQAVHRPVGLHIHFDFRDAAQLVVGFLVGESVLKLALPRVILREGKAFHLRALGVQFDQPFGQFLRRRLGACLGARPVRAAELVQPYPFRFAAADVFADKVEAGRGDIQEICAGKRNFDEIALRAVDRHALHADKAADAVVLVYHKVARCQVGVGLDTVAVGLLDLRLFASREYLPLGDDDQPEVRVFKPCGQRAFHHAHLTALGQQVADGGGQPGLGQRVAHVAAAQFAATQHSDCAPLLGVAADIGGCHIQIAAVGVHLVRDKVL